MKNLQKFILPLLVVAIITIIYMFYFSPKKGLGDFNDFDPNAHTQKEIQVLYLADQGIQYSADNSRALFYVRDKKGRRVRVNAPNELPEGIENAKVVTLFGHLHQDTFEASEVILE